MAYTKSDVSKEREVAGPREDSTAAIILTLAMHAYVLVSLVRSCSSSY